MNDQTRQLNLEGDIAALSRVIAYSINRNLNFRGRWQSQPMVTMAWPLKTDETVPCIQAALETEQGQNSISRNPASLEEHCQILIALCAVLDEVDSDGNDMEANLVHAFKRLNPNYSLDFDTTNVVYISLRFPETT